MGYNSLGLIFTNTFHTWRTVWVRFKRPKQMEGKKSAAKSSKSCHRLSSDSLPLAQNLLPALPLVEVFVFLEFKPANSGIGYYGYEKHYVTLKFLNLVMCEFGKRHSSFRWGRRRLN